jgi:hypothetical protein
MSDSWTLTFSAPSFPKWPLLLIGWFYTGTVNGPESASKLEAADKWFQLFSPL